jgi:hypothetical protein
MASTHRPRLKHNQPSQSSRIGEFVALRACASVQEASGVASLACNFEIACSQCLVLCALSVDDSAVYRNTPSGQGVCVLANVR